MGFTGYFPLTLSIYQIEHQDIRNEKLSKFYSKYSHGAPRLSEHMHVVFQSKAMAEQM